ncbi:PepSY-associated TM helix domain-containing protein [Paucibacter sp. PLA-PC-4]|uniref:PepSY-associated TM helix domain-containing protein n=1 Tax=Paucibacter sp. PLA-PC-4 TaxID=2993655 RepID=UPI0022496B6B|nr:PepSY-associated TM helix domain-containing protein [Paucibacter sp. PLA-PC-4]MCX2863248.1 PepSY-associated TM helix domain-containing protein [Paucibacter sp. PLA-PC-4]
MRADGAKEGFRQAMAWLHTWVGLVLGWLLFAIFLSGTLAFFKLELNHWSRPELHGLGPAQPLDAVALARAEASLHWLAPAAQSWRLSLPDERRPVAALSWREAADPARPGQRAKFEQRWLDPASGAPVQARATFGAGEFFYRFHFELRSAQQSRWILEGRWLVGLATLLMFVALLSGIVTHRRFFKDFFTFRPSAKAAQRAWLDAHNISGVLALPFYLLITFSGLMTLHSLYMSPSIAAAYGKDIGAYFSELAGDPLPRSRGLTPKSGETEPLPQLGEGAWDRLLSQARAEWPEGRIEAVSVLREGDQTLVEFNRHEGDRLQYRSPRQVFDAGSGERLHLADTHAPAAKTYGVLYGLHIARFAGLPLRWLLFGFGLLGSAMIATGLVLWCVKRRAEAERRGPARLGLGHRLVAVLNIAAIAGLPLAMAGFFYANRLLPLGLTQRPDAELKVFFATWGAGLLIAMMGGGWRLVFGLGAAAFAGLPLLDVLHTGTLPQGMLLGIDLALLAAAALLACLAWKSQPPAARRARTGPSGQMESA